MEAALLELARNVSSMDAVILGLMWGIVKVVTANKGIRVPTTLLALKLLGGLAAGVFIARLLIFLAGRGII